MGLTTALTRGFGAAKGDILVFYPADLQFHPRDIPRMVTAIENGADMICGKKVGSYGKWLVSKIYNLLTRLLFPSLKVSDLNSVKAFRRHVYHDLPTLREGWHRYLAVFAAERGYMVREVPVKLYQRTSGESKFARRSRIMKGLTDLIAVKFQLSVLGDPMHLFGRISVWFFALAFLIAVVAFVLRFGFGIGYRPMLYAVILFAISGIVTFVVGIVVETLVYLRDSLNELKQENRNLNDTVSKMSSRLNKLSGGQSRERGNGSGDRRGGRRRKSMPRPQDTGSGQSQGQSQDQSQPGSQSDQDAS
jgi:glycosyltransferase involved in cell wall biosynthesis